METTQHTGARKKKERGQSLAEFAMILPLLLLIVMGVLDFGRVLMTYAQQSAAVRNALRYGVIIGYAETGAGGRPNYTDCNAMADIARSAFFAKVLNVTVEFLKPDNSIVPCNQADLLLDRKLSNGDRLHIVVQAEVDLLTPFFPDSLPIVIEGQRTLVKEITLAQVNNPGGGGDDDDDGGDDDDGEELPTIEESTAVSLLPEGAGTRCNDARSNRFVGLTWNAATDPDVEGFYIYARPASGGEWTVVGDIPDPAATECSYGLNDCFTFAATWPAVMDLWTSNMRSMSYRVAAYGMGGAVLGTSANEITHDCVFRVYQLNISPEGEGTYCSGNKNLYVGLNWDETIGAHGYYIYANQGKGSVQVGQVFGGDLNQCGYSVSGFTNVNGVNVPGCYRLKPSEWASNKSITFMVVPFTAGGAVYYFEEAVVLTPIFRCK